MPDFFNKLRRYFSHSMADDEFDEFFTWLLHPDNYGVRRGVVAIMEAPAEDRMRLIDEWERNVKDLDN